MLFLLTICKATYNSNPLSKIGKVRRKAINFIIAHFMKKVNILL